MNFLNSHQLESDRKSPLYDNVSIVANHYVSQQSKEDVSKAVALVEHEMLLQEVDFINLKRLNLFLCKGGQFTTQITDIGNHIAFAVINCDLIEDIKHQCIRVAIIVEEMVHFYWDISNELKIKHIVVHIINKMWPNIKVEDIFALDTIPKDKRKDTLTLSKNAFDDKINY